MTPVALWVLSANAASVDFAQTEMLAAPSPQQLVDLSAIESATMTVWFDGVWVPLLVGDSNVDPLLEYIAKTRPWAENNTTLQLAVAARLMASVSFEVQVLNDARKGVVVSVPAVHWGELEAFGHRPDDRAVCESVRSLLFGLDAWSNLHLLGGRDALDESSLSLQYVKSGDSYLLRHVERIAGDKTGDQMDMTFAEVDGVPWPKEMVFRSGKIFFPIHVGDVVLKDAVAPFLPAERVWTPALGMHQPEPPIDPADSSGWQEALEAIDKHFYSVAAAEALHFTLARTSDFSTWLSDDFVEKFNKKNRLTMTPPKRNAEIARLSGEVTYDVDVVLSPRSLRVRAVHLGELEQALTAKEVEALRQRAQKEIYDIVFGAPNHMTLHSGGFFPSTEVVTNVEPDPGGTVITTANAAETRKILLDDETGLPAKIWFPDGTRSDYTFQPSPMGTMLVTAVRAFNPNGRLVETIAYTYGEVGGVTVPTSVKTILSTYTLTDWRIVDATAPFLARPTAPAAMSAQ